MADKQTEQIKNALSYGTFISDIMSFKRAGTRNGDEFNYLDMPSQLYFKVLFNFWNGDTDNPGDKLTSGGLLSPTWKVIPSGDVDYYNYNSAWAYLKLNGEEERANNLIKFVELLSNISTYSPWYFAGIEGIDAARQRNVAETGELKFEERQKITIKCLNDSFDDRIGTLLDLYRSIVWSWTMKREVLPSNLRKFDMAIYIFSAPFYTIHDCDGDYAGIGEDFTGYVSSYKYLEFHNCEISYNSCLAGLGQLDNMGGVSPQYNIDIYFDDVYENRYNEFMMQNIGDIISYDTSAAIDLARRVENKSIDNTSELNKRLNFYNDESGFLTKMVKDVENGLINYGKSKIKSIYLGNIFGFSIKEAMMDYEKIFKEGKAASVKKVVDDIKRTKKPSGKLKVLENIFTKKTIKNNI